MTVSCSFIPLHSHAVIALIGQFVTKPGILASLHILLNRNIHNFKKHMDTFLQFTLLRKLDDNLPTLPFTSCCLEDQVVMAI